MATDWRVAVLRQGRFPITPQNLQNLAAWQKAEGGHTNNAAKWNWLNTTQGTQYPSMNSVGVRVFPDFNTGVQKTVETLNNGHYAGILQALKTGKTPVDQFAQTVYSSPWGTKANISGRQNSPTAGATVPQAGVPATKMLPQVTIKQLNGLARQFGFKSFRQAFGFDDDGQIAALLKTRDHVPKVATIGQGVPVYNNSGQQRLPASVRKVVDIADNYLGTPYQWGAKGPTAFDCSGLIQFVYKKVGIDTGGYTIAQWKSGQPVPKGAPLHEGDAVFFNWGTHPETGEQGPQHVGLYIGNGLFIQAPKTGDVVKISRLADRTDFLGARRWITTMPLKKGQKLKASTLPYTGGGVPTRNL